MSLQCRTCGEAINGIKAANIFEGGDEIINKIALLTGIWLTDEEDLPRNICASCLMDLNKSIKFRELCIRTNHLFFHLAADVETLEDVGEDLDDPLNSRKDLGGNFKNEKEEQHEEEHEEDQEKDQWDEQEEKQRQQLAKAPEDEGQLKEEPEVDMVTDNNMEELEGYTKSAQIKSIGTLTIQEKNCPESCKRRDTNGHKKNRRAKSYFCDQCGKEFNDKGNLNLHLVRHTGVRPFQCPECGKKEFNLYLLNIHIRVKHRGEKPYACKYCSECFVNSANRYRHQIRMHERHKTTEKKFVCTCGLRFETKTNLRKHEFVHTGERPFQCHICNVSFNRNSNLKTHFRSKLHKKKAQPVPNILLDIQI